MDGFSNGFRAFVDYNPTTDVDAHLHQQPVERCGRANAPRPASLLAGETVEPRVPTPIVARLPEGRRKQIEGVYRNFGSEQELVFVTPTFALLGSEYPLVATGATTLFGPMDFFEFTISGDSIGNVTELRFGSGANAVSIPRLRARPN